MFRVLKKRKHTFIISLKRLSLSLCYIGKKVKNERIYNIRSQSRNRSTCLTHHSDAG